jgi:hypothetical protein
LNIYYNDEIKEVIIIMTKGVILRDSKGNWIGVTEQWAKSHLGFNAIFWSYKKGENYKKGDYCEVVCWPACNVVWNEEKQDYIFVPYYYWDEDDCETVHVYNHGYNEERKSFSSGNFEPNKDEERCWIDLEGYKIPVLS